MKRAKQKRVKPRQGIVPLFKKSGPHQRKDKRASRARQKQKVRRESSAD